MSFYEDRGRQANERNTVTRNRVRERIITFDSTHVYGITSSSIKRCVSGLKKKFIITFGNFRAERIRQYGRAHDVFDR